MGMCGAVVVLFEHRPAGDVKSAAWARRLTYNFGRLCFYALLGSVAGASGAALKTALGVSQGLMLLRILAAALVIAIGLNLIFDWRLTRFLETAGTGLWSRLSRLAKYVLPVDTSGRALAAGILWGALPCGLVYSAVAIAATTGSLAGGAGVMFAFWLGTLPAILAVGTSAQLLHRLKSHRTLRRAAGIVVILIGLAALIPIGSNSSTHQHHSAVNLNPGSETTSIC
jgi:hypothetical protein